MKIYYSRRMKRSISAEDGRHIKHLGKLSKRGQDCPLRKVPRSLWGGNYGRRVCLSCDLIDCVGAE